MAVTNIVVLLFWAGDALQRESAHLRQMLAHAAQVTSSAGTFLPPMLTDFLDRESGACLYWNGNYYGGARSEDFCRQELLASTNKSEPNSIAQTPAPRLALTEPTAFRYLRVVVNTSSSGQLLQAVAVPFTSVLHSLWEKEKIVGVYLLFNALVLTALAFFRLLKRYLLPVDKMVMAAETYSGEGFHATLFDRPTDELGHLASSIQAMVRRIEADKESLSATVRELALKNELLRSNQQEMVQTEKLAAVGRLAAGLAHEIGNPLGVVQGYVQLLSMSDCGETERAEFGDKAIDELARIDRLIRQLLDHARSCPAPEEWCDVYQLAEEVVQSFQVGPLSEGIGIDLLGTATSVLLRVKVDALRQVLINCLLNAVDAVHARHGKNGGKIVVTVREDVPRQDNLYRHLLEIAVDDNGSGVSPKDREVIFEPFFTTKDPGKGTGLGLSVSRALVESMGGHMRLSSKNEQGVTMSILLPFEVYNGSDEIAVQSAHRYGKRIEA